ncbi:MAG: hypothetical protein ACJ790_08750 [Myxococcaceae bacterium]
MAPLERVGPLRLRYEPSLLIGEPALRDPREPIALGLRILALALGIGALASLVLGSGGSFPLTTLVTGLLAVAAFMGSAFLERRVLSRRFILNFGTESLRIDDLPTPLKRPRTRTLHFDLIASVDVVADGPGYVIAVTLKPDAGRPSLEVLTSRVPAEHIEELRRLWRVLRDAFGLSRPGAELRPELAP